MTPTIQCCDDQSMQMPPASVLCSNDLFFQESQTSASDIITSGDVRNNHQYSPYLRSRHLAFNRKKTNVFKATLKTDMKNQLNNSSSSEVVSEADLKTIRKRQALLLVTVQTMALFYNNQILERKLSALHKKIIEVKKNDTKNNESNSE